MDGHYTLTMRLLMLIHLAISSCVSELIRNMYFEENLMNNYFHFKIEINSIDGNYEVSWEKLAKNGSYCKVSMTDNVNIQNTENVAYFQVKNLTMDETGRYRLTVSSGGETDVRNLAMCDCKNVLSELQKQNEDSPDDMVAIKRSSLIIAVTVAVFIVVGSVTLLILGLILKGRSGGEKKRNARAHGVRSIDGHSSHIYDDINSSTSYQELRESRGDIHNYRNRHGNTEDVSNSQYLHPVHKDTSRQRTSSYLSPVRNESSHSTNPSNRSPHPVNTDPTTKLPRNFQNSNNNSKQLVHHTENEGSNSNLGNDLHVKQIKKKAPWNRPYENIATFKQTVTKKKCPILPNSQPKPTACPIISVEKSRLT